MLVAAVATLALAGCTATPSSSPSSPAPTRSPAATKPLACADLADHEKLAAALDGAATARDPTIAALGATGFRLAYTAAIPAAGGLLCDWIGATGSAGAPDLSVELLPDPEDRWTSMLFGDGPSLATKTFGSHTVTADFGDPGFGVTTRINGVWMLLRLTEPVLAGGTDSAGADRVLNQSRRAIQTILDTLAAAAPAQLSWPSTPPRGGGVSADTCRRYLTPELLDSVIGRKLDYETPVPLGPTSSIEDLAIQRAGYPDCVVVQDETSRALVAQFDVAVGAARRLDVLRTGIPAPASNTYAPTTLKGLPGREWAIASNHGDIVFTLGDDVVEVSSGEDTTKLAEAIVGQAY
jgi:hypothetical protein